MNPLYQLNLDFAKGLNFTKAIMARQGDAGVLVEVHPFMKGVQVVPTGYTFTLKGTTPSGRYVDAAGTIKDNLVEFSLDGRFMSESGYYSNCYVEMSKGDTVLTSQDIIFFSLKVSDITQGQGAEYVSRLEQLLKDFRNEFDTLLLDLNSQFNELKIKTDELITEYNNKLADALAKFQQDVQDSIDTLTATATDLEGRYTLLDELAKSLDTKVNELKEEVSKLGNLQVMYSNSIDFGDYDYSGNPNIAPNVGFNDFYDDGSQTGYTATDEVDHIAVTKTADASAAGKLANLRALLPNKTYTLSVDVWADTELPSGAIFCGMHLKEGTQVRTVWALIGEPVRTNRTTYSVTFTTAADFVTTEYSRITLWFDASAGACTGYLGYNIKIEEGSTATPYQPNLLDAPYYLSKVALGENLIKPESQQAFTNSNDIIKTYNTKPMVKGKKYTIILEGTKPATQVFRPFFTRATGDAWEVGDLQPVEGLTDIWSATFTAADSHPTNPQVQIYQVPNTSLGQCTIKWLKLEEGDTRTPNINEYKYRGIAMRDSNNPKEYVWDLAPKYVENNLATDTKISEIVSQAHEYTDNSVAAVNTSLTNTADDLGQKINTNIANITTISDAMPLFAVYGEGRDLTDSSDGTKIPIGNLIATDFFHTASDLPYTISSDGITLTATRNCVLFFEGSVKLHGNNTFKYAYVKIRKNGSDTNFANLGSSANLNYVTSQAGQYVHTLRTGDRVEFTLGIDAAARMFHLQLLSLKISELNPV